MLLVRKTELDSRSLFTLWLTESESRKLVLGDRGGYRFYILDITKNNGQKLNLGIAFFGHGIEPAWTDFADESRFVVGFDNSVGIVDTEHDAIIQEVELGGVFYEFVPSEPGTFAVLHELGIAKFTFDGKQLWSVSAGDIVSGLREGPDGTIIITRWEDQTEIVIDSKSGTII